MDKSAWLTIAAIILGPILAVQIQNIIQRIKDSRNRKMQIFKALMATRATPLYPAHVEGLNMIDIEFYKHKKVVDTWKLLHDNFSNYPQDPKAPDFNAKLAQCTEKSNDLLVDLLYEMSKVLGYKFDKVLLKRGCYIPKGHGDFQIEQDFIRKSMVQLFLGKLPFPVFIKNIPQSENNDKQPDKMENNKIDV